MDFGLFVKTKIQPMFKVFLYEGWNGSILIVTNYNVDGDLCLTFELNTETGMIDRQFNNMLISTPFWENVNAGVYVPLF